MTTTTTEPWQPQQNHGNQYNRTMAINTKEPQSKPVVTTSHTPQSHKKIVKCSWCWPALAVFWAGGGSLLRICSVKSISSSSSSCPSSTGSPSISSGAPSKSTPTCIWHTTTKKHYTWCQHIQTRGDYNFLAVVGHMSCYPEFWSVMVQKWSVMSLNTQFSKRRNFNENAAILPKMPRLWQKSPQIVQFAGSSCAFCHICALYFRNPSLFVKFFCYFRVYLPQFLLRICHQILPRLWRFSAAIFHRDRNLCHVW